MSVELGDVRVRRVRAALLALVVALLVGNAVALSAYEPSDDSDDGAVLPNGSTGTSESPVPGRLGDTGGGPAPGTGRTATTKPGAAASKGTSSATTTTVAVEFPEVNEGDFRYELTLSAVCVTPGQQMTATFRLGKANVGVVAMPVYSDGAVKGQHFNAASKEDGVLVYTWNAHSALGPGVMMTQAHDRETDKKGTVSRRFRVVAPGSSC